MITQEQFITGILKYADNEIIPALPTAGKWIAGTAVLLGTTKINEIMTSLMNNSIVCALGIIDADGYIDSTKLLDALYQSAAKYGSAKLDIPLIGTLTFCEKDVEKLKSYMLGGYSR